MPAKRTAMYYPHIAIDNERFLKNSLLLWDQIELITPFGHLETEAVSTRFRPAFELLARPHVPTKDEQRRAHLAVLEIANRQRLPSWFFPKHVNPNLRYRIYPEKFLPETWKELQRSALVQRTFTRLDPPLPIHVLQEMRKQHAREAYETTQAFGLTMMSILADTCAGSLKQLVTDEVDSFVASDKYLKVVGNAYSRWGPARSHDRLVTLSIETLNVSNISIERLLEVRKREEKNPAIRKMRHSYTDKLDTCIARLSTEAKSKADIVEIERVFRQEIQDDLNLLKEELKDESSKTVFSKEFGVATLALAGTLVEPVTGSILAAGALTKRLFEARSSRRKVLSNHAMAWLYEIERVRVH